MRNKVFIIFLVSSVIVQCILAQDTIPTLKGTVNISITTGTFDCDIVLENIPRIKDYVIRLNSGMNILYFKNLANDNLISYEKALNDTLSTYESTAYFFPDNTGKAKFLPRSLGVVYTGKYPVAKDSVKNFSRQDWKGNIAFNGYSVRTDGLQTCWYPVLYDISKDAVLNKVKYDLTINCADCNMIYLNGSTPVAGTKARLKSDIPYDLSMYPGKYKMAKVDSTYFLNPDMTEAQLKTFGNLTNSFKKFYQDKLGINYKTNITYVQTTPTSKFNAWLFVSYPTIFNIGYGKYGLKGLFDEPDGEHYKAYIAHELGHYYFGTYKVFNSELGDMITEAFSEFMSLEATRQVIADSIYRQIIAKKLKALKDFKPVAFAAVKSKADYQNRELYVYYYAPILFTAIKKEIGEPAMWLWLKTMLTSGSDRTNYEYLVNTLSAAVPDKQKLALIKSKYLDSDTALNNATETIGQQ